MCEIVFVNKKLKNLNVLKALNKFWLFRAELVPYNIRRMKRL